MGIAQRVVAAAAGIASVVYGAPETLANGCCGHTLYIGDRNCEDRVTYEVWVAQLRACTRDDVATAEKQPVVADDVPSLIKGKQAVAIKGRLAPGGADCTLMGCSSECCNSCSFDWVVAPHRSCPNWRFGVRRKGEYFQLQGAGTDCAVRRFGGQAVEVIIAGWLEGGSAGDRIVATDMCRVGSGAASQLTDADYARLMSPSPARKATIPRGCPQPVEGPPPPPGVRAKPQQAGPKSLASELNL